jgi:hypothetical protein
MNDETKTPAYSRRGEVDDGIIPSQKQHTTNIRDSIKEALDYCVEYNHVGHEVEEEGICNWIKSKGKRKCDCPWGQYEAMLQEKLCSLFLTLLDELEMPTEKKIAKGFDVTPWLRNYGIDDGTTLTAGEAEEMLEQYSWDLLEELNTKISHIKQSLKGKVFPEREEH